MKIKNTFLGGKMNKDFDERLVPNGEYREMRNLFVNVSEGADAGAAENPFSNVKLSSLDLQDAVCIGAVADPDNNRLFWFVSSSERDLVLEYEETSNTVTTVLDHTTVLNFSEEFLVQARVIDNFLVFTDDNNGIRITDIDRAKGFAPDGFDEDDIKLIKRPPIFPPKTELKVTDSTLENNLENKFVYFAYRYKYLDGDYSCLSAFNKKSFEPSSFDLDYQTLENNGMVNLFNAVDVTFNTGDKRVTDVDLVYKDSNSDIIKLIQTFNKEELGWGNNEEQTFEFSKDKYIGVLPQDEIKRTFDNVPKKSKTLDYVANRLMFANYEEQYDIVNENGDKIKLDYIVDYNSQQIQGEELEVNYLGNALEITLPQDTLKEGNRLSISFVLFETLSGGSSTYNHIAEYVFDRDYVNAQDLATDESFINFIEISLTNNFENTYISSPPDGAVVTDITNFVVAPSSTDSILISYPTILYTITDTGEPLTGRFASEVSSATITETGSLKTVKTNRDYEVVLIYLDEDGRKTVGLDCPTNTVYVPTKESVNVNNLVVTINHEAPAWAKYYQFAVKQDKIDYQNVYATLFYQEGLYRWVKLEGASRQKVREGDTLIVKSDLSGAVDELIKVRVLEVAEKDKDFLEDNTDQNGNDIKEEAGLYMKIKPEGFDMNISEQTFYSYNGYAALRSGFPQVELGRTSGEQGSILGFLDDNTNTYVDIPVTAGSRISLSFRNFESDGYDERYNKDFVVQSDYNNFQEWYETEVINLGSQSDKFNVSFSRRSNNALWFIIQGTEEGSEFERSKLDCKVDIILSAGTLVFETEPIDNLTQIYYETSDVNSIVNGNHLSNPENENDVDQDFENGVPAVINSKFYNAFNQGNGVESYKYKDAFLLGKEGNTEKDVLANFLTIFTRPVLTITEEYSQVRRSTDITYSGIYNFNTNFNALNEFNLSTANFKEDMDRSFGSIQRIDHRDRDIIVFQEDIVSRVLVNKRLLTTADGNGSLETSTQVLGDQIIYTAENGVSRNPESIIRYKNNYYFTDTKRGTVCRLGMNGITEITPKMKDFFRDTFKNSLDKRKFGGYDPYHDMYVLHNKVDKELNYDKNYTVFFTESTAQGGGFPCFHDFIPDFMLGLNNNFYTFNTGELYIHNENNFSTDRNNYYGIPVESKVEFIVNTEPSTIKVLDAVSIEGNKPWNVDITSYISDRDDFSSTDIKKEEFLKKEGIWYTYSNRNTDIVNTINKAVYGIGNIDSFTADTITVSGNNYLTTAGDVLYKASDMTEVATIESVNGNVITLNNIVQPLGNYFVVASNNPRVTGSHMRGYVFKIDLTNDSNDKLELFAFNSDVTKSFT